MKGDPAEGSPPAGAVADPAGAVADPAGAVADPAGAVADPAGAVFAGRPVGLAVLARVRAVVDATGPHTVRTTRSQVAFRRARSFAWLWAPGRYLARPGAEVVLTIALGRHDPSPRFKEVTHPSPRHWIHHLEARDAAEIDDEVAAWLSEAWERAG